MSKSNTTEESVKIKRKGHEPLKIAMIPWVTPWAVGFVTLPLGAVLNWQAHSPGMAVIVTLCAGTLTWITYKTWSRRHEHTRYAGRSPLPTSTTSRPAGKSRRGSRSGVSRSPVRRTSRRPRTGLSG